jgi:hypothetical protein
MAFGKGGAHRSYREIPWSRLMPKHEPEVMAVKIQAWWKVEIFDAEGEKCFRLVKMLGIISLGWQTSAIRIFERNSKKFGIDPLTGKKC